MRVCGTTRRILAAPRAHSSLASVREVPMGAKGRPIYRVLVTGRPDLERFLVSVGGFGEQRAREASAIRARVATWRMRSISATEVPPNFIAIIATYEFLEVWADLPCPLRRPM